MAVIRIVIPCRNADKTIEQSLSAIHRSTDIDFEVIVVDDGENTALPLLQKRFQFAIKKTKGCAGAGVARNLGAKGFNGPVLVFIDADVELGQPTTLSLLIEPLCKGQADASVGNYSGVSRPTFAATYKHRYLAYTYGRKIGKLENTFWTALCAVNRERFDALGGFRECHDGAGPEDVEFGIELSKRGSRVMAVPEAQAHHLASLTVRGLLSNDLRKGSEDVCIHWKQRIPLTDNRHVEVSDMLAVFLASLFLLLLCLQFVVGVLPVALCAGAYLFVRRTLFRMAFGGEGVRFLAQSIVMSFCLDVVRALAVVYGTYLWRNDLARGRQKPSL